jgi:hypothetical protein
MPNAVSFPPRLILAAAMITGVLLALTVHVLGQRFGLDLAALWRPTKGETIPASAALGWWLVALAAFIGGYVTASLMKSAASGQLPRRMRQFLIVVGLLVLAAAGQAASGPSAIATVAGVAAGLVALCLGAAMAFCGAHFAMGKA